MFNSARCAAALAIVAVASLPTMACAQQCEDLVLGAALSATGIYASNGNNTKNGYEFAVKKMGLQRNLWVIFIASLLCAKPV